MGGFNDRDRASLDHQPRFETPRVTGYRQGMSATGMIGSRLGRVFDVTREVPGEMGLLLQAIDSTKRR